MPERWAEARRGLVPVVRPVSGPLALWRAARATGEAVLREPVAEWLHGLAAWDAPGVRVFVRARHLAAWGVGWPDVWAEACANLDPAAGLAQVPGGWELRAADGLAASRLALPGFLAGFRGRVAGEPVAAAPTQRALVVAGSEDPALPVIQRAAIRAFCAEGEPVSPRLYRAGAPEAGGGLEAAGGGQAGTEDGWAARLLRWHLYRESRELWEGETEQRIAACGAMRGRDGRAVLFVRLLEEFFAEGGIMPTAEVAILPGERAVAWEDLEACAAGWLEDAPDPVGGPGWLRLRAGCPGWAALEGRAGRA